MVNEAKNVVTVFLGLEHDGSIMLAGLSAYIIHVHGDEIAERSTSSATASSVHGRTGKYRPWKTRAESSRCEFL